MAKKTALVLSVIIAIAGCIKRGDRHVLLTPPASTDTVTFYDAQFCDAYFFKPGTYWIYQDSATGRMDSFYVVSLDTVEHGRFNLSFVPCAEINIMQKNVDNTAASDSAYWVLSLCGKNAMIDHYRGAERVHPEYHYIPAFYYYAKPESMLIAAGDTVRSYADKVTTDSVFLFTHRTNTADTGDLYGDRSVISTYLQDDFYLQRRTGIIKMRINHPYHSLHFVWTLVRSHIII